MQLNISVLEGGGLLTLPVLVFDTCNRILKARSQRFCVLPLFDKSEKLDNRGYLLGFFIIHIFAFSF